MYTKDTDGNSTMVNQAFLNKLVLEFFDANLKGQGSFRSAGNK